MAYEILSHKNPTQVEMDYLDPELCSGTGMCVPDEHSIEVSGKRVARCPQCIRLQPAKEVK
jgi:hypothetical protein